MFPGTNVLGTGRMKAGCSGTLDRAEAKSVRLHSSEWRESPVGFSLDRAGYTSTKKARESTNNLAQYTLSLAFGPTRPTALSRPTLATCHHARMVNPSPLNYSNAARRLFLFSRFLFPAYDLRLNLYHQEHSQEHGYHFQSIKQPEKDRVVLPYSEMVKSNKCGGTDQYDWNNTAPFFPLPGGSWFFAHWYALFCPVKANTQNGPQRSHGGLWRLFSTFFLSFCYQRPDDPFQNRHSHISHCSWQHQVMIVCHTQDGQNNTGYAYNACQDRWCINSSPFAHSLTLPRRCVALVYNNVVPSRRSNHPRGEQAGAEQVTLSRLDTWTRSCFRSQAARRLLRGAKVVTRTALSALSFSVFLAGVRGL